MGGDHARRFHITQTPSPSFLLADKTDRLFTAPGCCQPKCGLLTLWCVENTGTKANTSSPNRSGNWPTNTQDWIHGPTAGEWHEFHGRKNTVLHNLISITPRTNTARKCARRGCHETVTGPNMFHSPECRKRYYQEFNRVARKRLSEKDNGTCSRCGMDTERARRIIDHAWKYCGSSLFAETDTRPVFEQHISESLDISRHRIYGSLWDADHIVPISEGCDPYDLKNFRTLCIACHARMTHNVIMLKSAKSRPMLFDITWPENCITEKERAPRFRCRRTKSGAIR